MTPNGELQQQLASAQGLLETCYSGDRAILASITYHCQTYPSHKQSLVNNTPPDILASQFNSPLTSALADLLSCLTKLTTFLPGFQFQSTYAHVQHNTCHSNAVLLSFTPLMRAAPPAQSPLLWTPFHSSCAQSGCGWSGRECAVPNAQGTLTALSPVPARPRDPWQPGGGPHPLSRVCWQNPRPCKALPASQEPPLLNIRTVASAGWLLAGLLDPAVHNDPESHAHVRVSSLSCKQGSRSLICIKGCYRGKLSSKALLPPNSPG